MKTPSDGLLHKLKGDKNDNSKAERKFSRFNSRFNQTAHQMKDLYAVISSQKLKITTPATYDMKTLKCCSELRITEFD